jgi:orotate phosphoribosyltransferase
MIERNRVEEIFRKSEVLLEGHFLLTSGRHSDRYMQCAKLLQYPWYAEELVKSLAEAYKDTGIDAVIGPATGGIILAYEMARQLNVKNLFAEREEGKMTLRRGFTLPADARVLVIEDVITTGGTVQEVIDLVNNLGCTVAGVAVLADRSMGRVTFGDIPITAAYTADVVTWAADECPLCKEGKLPAVKPGSRK